MTSQIDEVTQQRLKKFVGELNLNLPSELSQETNDFIAKLKGRFTSTNVDTDKLERKVLRFIRGKTKRQRVVDIINHKLKHGYVRTYKSLFISRLKKLFTRKRKLERSVASAKEASEPVVISPNGQKIISPEHGKSFASPLAVAPRRKGTWKKFLRKSSSFPAETIERKRPRSEVRKRLKNCREILPWENENEKKPNKIHIMLMNDKSEHILVVDHELPGGDVLPEDKTPLSAAIRIFRDQTNIGISPNEIVGRVRLFEYEPGNTVILIKSTKDFSAYLNDTRMSMVEKENECLEKYKCLEKLKKTYTTVDHQK